MTDREQRAAAKAFAEFWKGKGYEKGESQLFWTSLLRDVFGVEKPETVIVFEEQVRLDHTSFIDAAIPSTKVLIEQKSLGKDLNEPVRQSDGTYLNPFQQAKRYITELPLSRHPRWVVTCNFAEFYVYDMENPKGEPEIIRLADLEKEFYRLRFLIDTGNEHLKRELELSVAAGEIVGLIYDALAPQYAELGSARALKSLNVLCVRLVFCLYAEDAGVFGRRGMFHDYLQEFDAQKTRRAVIDLFKILDTPPDKRDPYLKDDNPALRPSLMSTADFSQTRKSKFRRLPTLSANSFSSRRAKISTGRKSVRRFSARYLKAPSTPKRGVPAVCIIQALKTFIK